MPRTVADQFVETLAATGVKRIYGVVGDSLNGLTDAIRRQGKIENAPRGRSVSARTSSSGGKRRMKCAERR
jgi:glyoxylate carboligase